MKTISIHLTQEPTAGLFRVVRFSNTVQLSVGQLVKADKVEEWCAMNRVNVHVDGMSKEEENAPVLEDSAQQKALKL